MRRSRLKVVGRGAYYHVFNRVSGEEGHLPFGEREKERFVELLLALSKLFNQRLYRLAASSGHLQVYRLLVM